VKFEGRIGEATVEFEGSAEDLQKLLDWPEAKLEVQKKQLSEIKSGLSEKN
jgi:hypothetical protein